MYCFHHDFENKNISSTEMKQKKKRVDARMSLVMIFYCNTQLHSECHIIQTKTQVDYIQYEIECYKNFIYFNKNI